MATVPVYDRPMETERALPGARQESVVTPALLDAGAEQTEKLGKAVEGAGSALGAIALHMQERENADVLFQHEAADKEAYLAYDRDVREKRQGHGAKGVTTDTAAWWRERIAKNTEGMTDEQKRIYTKRAMALQFQSLDTVSKFEAHQLEVAHDASWTADKVNTINLGAVNPALVDKNIAEIKKLNAYQGQRKGWDKSVLEAVNTDDITKLHKQTIQTLVEKDPANATAYFKAHEQEIAGSERAEIGKFAEKATAVSIGVTAAQEVWTTDGPKGDNDASNLDKMEAAIRAKYKDNIPARDAALKELEHLDSVRDKSIKARDANRTASVNSMLMNGIPLAQVQRTPAWAALDGTEQRKIALHEESIAAQKESRAAARESREYTAEVRRQHQLTSDGLDIMLKLSDPERLVTLSRDNIINLRTTIGDQNATSLMSKWDALTKSGQHLTEAKLDDQQFKVFAQRAGLDITPKGDDDKERLINLRDKAERIIASEQQAKKRPLTRAEKDDILQREIDNTVIQHNRVMFDQPVPAIALPLDKQASAYVVVNGQEVKLSSIPAADRAAIVKARKEAGLPVTEKAIAEMWVKKQALKKKPGADFKTTDVPLGM